MRKTRSCLKTATYLVWRSYPSRFPRLDCPQETPGWTGSAWRWNKRQERRAIAGELLGRETGPGGKRREGISSQGWKKSGWDVTQPFCYQLRMPPSRAWGRLLFKQLFFFFFEKLLFLQDAHSGLRNAVTHSRVASYCQNGLPPDTCNTDTKPSCFGSRWNGSTHFLHIKSIGTRTV